MSVYYFFLYIDKLCNIIKFNINHKGKWCNFIKCYRNPKGWLCMFIIFSLTYRTLYNVCTYMYVFCIFTKLNLENHCKFKSFITSKEIKYWQCVIKMYITFTHWKYSDNFFYVIIFKMHFWHYHYYCYYYYKCGIIYDSNHILWIFCILTKLNLENQCKIIRFITSKEIKYWHCVIKIYITFSHWKRF